jgi:hypothetical protein
MRLTPFALFALFAATFSFVIPAHADKLDRPTITMTREGSGLRVVVHSVTDYCSASAETHIVRSSNVIRIQRDRPSPSSRLGRCLTTGDLAFVVPDVPAGRYTVTYERLPLVAPVRWLQVASTSAIVE